KGDEGRIERVIEEVRHRPRWATWFDGFRDPFAHYSAEEYRALAERVGLRVDRIETEERRWDFGSREGFLGFIRTTSYNWTTRLPAQQSEAFLEEALDRYQELNGPGHVFRFFQMEAVLRPAGGGGGGRRPAAPARAPATSIDVVSTPRWRVGLPGRVESQALPSTASSSQHPR